MPYTVIRFSFAAHRRKCAQPLIRILGILLALVSYPALAGEDYPPPVREIVEQRCMVCHGCYDAPCQLKLDDWIGLKRGASKEKVYDGTRLRADALTRLHEDALTTEEWRDKGFYSVLEGERSGHGVLRRMLSLKEQHPQPVGGVLDDSFDFSLDRDQSCPKVDEFDDYADERPLQGMPYGFPGLDKARMTTLMSWLDDGAPGVPVEPRPKAEQQAVADWEAFLNGQDNRSRLMSRYIFEHLFIGDLYFSDLDGESGWYKLVRSRTGPGEPIEIIATRRPYDDPGSDAFFYRLQPRYTARLAKRHMPYALSEHRMARWRELFLQPDYDVAQLPGYEGERSANPFITFEALPVNARYRFMLDEAHFTIMAYIKGPVCRGQVALNVIDDHFWVVFTRPNLVGQDQRAAFLAREAKHMRLPQPKENIAVTLLKWRQYAKAQKEYLHAEAEAIAAVVDQGAISLDMSLIWDGGPTENDNAALTIFRHFDSASVVKGLVGQQPGTMWVIDYSLLERIHYLLVAGFDVYGGVGHQLESRLYMDFLRMEGEQNFLRLLPQDSRTAVRDHWYRGAKDHVKEFLLPPENTDHERETAIVYSTDDPKAELMARFQAHIPAAQQPRYAVERKELAGLMQGSSSAYSYLPEVAFLQILAADGGHEAYSLLHNRAHSNNAQLFGEDDRLLPDEDTLTVARDFVGAYPNMFFQINEKELSAFREQLMAMESPEHYTALVERFGVRRTAPWFWRLADDFTAQYRAEHPLEGGIFDLNRYENR